MTLAAVCVLAAGCTCSDLRTGAFAREPLPVLAVGPAWVGDTSQVVQVGVRHTYDRGPGCPTADRLRGYCVVEMFEPADVVSAVPRDPTIAAVEEIAGNTFRVRALTPGTTVVDVMARETTGYQDPFELAVVARAPEQLVLEARCWHGAERGEVWVRPQVEVDLDFWIESAGERLAVAGLPRLDFGALQPVDGGQAITDRYVQRVRVPAAATSTAITSPDFPGFSLPVRTYALADLSAVQIRSTRDGGAQPLRSYFPLPVVHRVGATAVCTEDAQWPRELKVEDGSVCRVNGADAGTTLTLAEDRPPSIGSELPGTCRLSARSPATGFTDTLTLEFAR